VPEDRIIFAMTRSSVDVDGLITDAWAAQFRNPAAISDIAEQIIVATSGGSVQQAWGYVHRAWGQRFRRDTEASKAAIAVAQRLFSEHCFAPGMALCDELLARERCDAGDESSARALWARAASVPAQSRGIWERIASHNIEFAIANRFSTAEEAIRVQSRAIVVARLSNDDAVIGQALSMLGGKHAELNNFETALTFCEEACERTKAMKPAASWYIAALNLLLVYNGMNEATLARALADELTEIDEQIYPVIREQSNILYARAFLLDGNLSAAQRALDRSRSVVAAQNHAHSWTATQAGLHVARGEVGDARDLCERWIANTPREEMFLSPSVALRIHRTAASACEALGDLRAALDYERRAIEYNEIELGRAARARRLALEIEFELERERSARDDAEKERSKSEAERVRLDELNHQLDAALQTRTRFLAAASHDLRQPAHALALYATALEQATSRTALRALARRMRATVSSLSGMFDGLIDLARVDAGAVDVRIEAVNVDELLSRLCAEYVDRMPQPQTAARLALRTASKPLFVRTDPVLLERVLRNLISNAVKYAGDSNILTAVRWRPDGWAIEVRDHGPGISHADQRQVFDEFFQAAENGDRREGLGLGLAIVRRFARLLDMEVTLRSATGHGSTFRVEIPQELVVPAPAAGTSRIGSTKANAAHDGDPLHVIVIDDDADARTSLTLVLELWGHSVSCAEHAAAAVNDCRQRGVTPDAIISDFQLGSGRTGVEEITHLRRTFDTALPALVVSGAHDTETRAAAEAVDAAYLTKPVRPLRLKSWLSAVRPRK